MPQLILMRHGKAVEPGGIADRERPLTSRGKRNSEAMGAKIAKACPPDRILCSTSRRTRETLKAVLSAMEVSDVEFVDALYDAPSDYDDVIARLGQNAARLLVIGHNPAIQETAVGLIGSGDPKGRAAVHESFPTSAFAVIEFDRPWKDLEPLSGKLVAFDTP